MADPTDDEQRPAHLFKPGQSGNPGGRPLGSRNKLGEDFLKALAADFEAHGPAAIAKTRETKPEVYVRVCASLLPKELNVRVNDLDNLDERELDRRIAAALEYLGGEGRAAEAADGEEAAAGPEQAGALRTIQ